MSLEFERFPFCLESVGIVFVHKESNIPKIFITDGWIYILGRKTYVKTRYDSYFRKNVFDLGIEDYCEEFEGCFWIDLDEYRFYEVIEYPNWIHRSYLDYKNDIENIQQSNSKVKNNRSIISEWVSESLSKIKGGAKNGS